MAIHKFVTIDLETGKKILKTLEASYIQFSDSRLEGVNDLDAALKAEITRALEAEGVLTSDLKKEVDRAKSAEKAIEDLIGKLGEDATVKAAIDRLKGLIDALELKVDNHIADDVKHITAVERATWNQAVATLDTKADKSTMTDELAKKVDKTYLFAEDKIKPDLLPSIAVNSVTTVTSVEKAMELEIENGDVVIINPNAKEVKTKDTVITGTFICVDITKPDFKDRFRQLYSNADSISKAEVNSLIKVETDRALLAEQELQTQITTEKDDTHDGSLAHKIKANKEAITAEVASREAAVKDVNDKINIINGGEEQSGSFAHAVKAEADRAKAAESELDTRLTAAKRIIDKLDGAKEVEGSVANIATDALTKATTYTDGKIKEVNSSAEALSNRVETLEDTVGDSGNGLVKDVTELQSKVAVIQGNDTTEGSIAKSLADAKEYTDEKVTDEKDAREAADEALDERIQSLEASENLTINLSCIGVVQHDLLTIRADNNVVKATLADSNVVGIVTRAEGPNSKTVVSGRVGGFSGLIPGKSYFLGNNGRITDKIPTKVGEHIIKIGVALSTTDLFVNVQEAIEIRA